MPYLTLVQRNQEKGCCTWEHNRMKLIVSRHSYQVPEGGRFLWLDAYWSTTARQDCHTVKWSLGNCLQIIGSTACNIIGTGWKPINLQTIHRCCAEADLLTFMHVDLIQAKFWLININLQDRYGLQQGGGYLACWRWTFAIFSDELNFSVSLPYEQAKVTGIKGNFSHIIVLLRKTVFFNNS